MLSPRPNGRGNYASVFASFAEHSLLIVDEIGYLPVIPGGGNLFFQLDNARYEGGAMIPTSDRGFADGVRFWRPRCRHGIARSAASPRRSHPDRRIKLPAATACRSHARARPLQGKHQLAEFRHSRRAAAVGHQKAEPTITIQPADHRKTLPTEDFYFGTFGHI